MPELKDPLWWARKGYTFLRHGDCPACSSPVEFWKDFNGNEVPINPKTYEPHFSQCERAKEYRTEIRMKEGVL